MGFYTPAAKAALVLSRRGSVCCVVADVICARLSASPSRRAIHTFERTTSMAAVGFCGEWFVFSGGTKLVAVHSKHDRSGEPRRVLTAGAELALLALVASGST